MTFQIQQKLI